MSAISFGGAVSGLDTNQMIQQLMHLERQPIRRLEADQQGFRDEVDAWSDFRGKLTTLSSAVEQFARQGSMEGRISATSSNEDIVEAREGAGQAEPGSHSIAVEQLATRGQVASVETFDSPELELEAGTFELTVGTETVEIEIADGMTMDDLRRKINEADAGAQASIVMTGEGEYKLVLTSRNTGAANQVSVNSTPPDFPGGDFEVTTEAQDALVNYGGVEVTRSTNVIDDLIQGVELDLQQAAPGQPVEVTVERDHDEIVDQVAEMVEAFNATVGKADQLTRTSQDEENRGPLSGDSTIRGIVNNMRNVIAQGVETEDGLRSYRDVLGIELTRSGELTLDESRLREALESDFDRVEAALARTASVDGDGVASAFAGRRVAEGDYDVEVLEPATRAEAGEAYTEPAEAVDFTVTSGTTTADVTVADGLALDDAVASINTQLEDAGISRLEAAAEEGELVFRATSWGSSGDFTIGAGVNDLVDGEIDGAYTGTDAEGTINGEEADGRGRTLRGTGDADGLSVSLAPNAEVGDTATVAVGAGFGGRLDEQLDLAAGRGGTVDRARDRIEGRISRIDDRIESYERRLEQRQRTLERQFTGMEQAIARLQDQQQGLMQAMGGGF